MNWDSAEEVNDCLRCIYNSDTTTFRIILINNYSTENDLHRIRSLYHIWMKKLEIYLIENESNLGYSGGNNSGLRFLIKQNMEGDILILNPDIIISQNTFSEMIRALDGQTGIVTVRTLDQDGKILYDAIRLKGFLQKYIITECSMIDTDYSQGSCMLIGRMDAETTGLFDERFFLYWEEVDLSLRIKALKRKLVSVTTTQIVKRRNSNKRKADSFYYSMRNARLVRQKHPESFSAMDYFKYVIWIVIISIKQIKNPGLFLKIFGNICCGLSDSSKNLYYSKTNHKMPV